MTIKSVQSGGGGDYTTIQACFNAADISTDTWECRIDDSATYAAATLSSATGTPSTSKYVALYASTSTKHSGYESTSVARISNASAGTHCLTIGVDYTMIGWLVIEQASTGTSDEGIRFTSGTNDVVVEKCVIHAGSRVSGQDGIYTGNWAATVRVDNTIVYGFGRANYHAQNYHLSTSIVQTWDIDFCSGFEGGNTSEGESGGINCRSGGGPVNMNVYHSGMFDTLSTYDDFSETIGGSGSVNWAGNHNACSDTSLTSRGISSNAQESLQVTSSSQSTGSYFVIVSTATPDYQLLDAEGGNKGYNTGSTAARTAPDSRQDFTLDIAGNTRPAVTNFDIGASEYTAAAASTGNPWYYYSQL